MLIEKIDLETIKRYVYDNRKSRGIPLELEDVFNILDWQNKNLTPLNFILEKGKLIGHKIEVVA